MVTFFLGITNSVKSSEKFHLHLYASLIVLDVVHIYPVLHRWVS
jgi:hypothetical protein